MALTQKHYFFILILWISFGQYALAQAVKTQEEVEQRIENLKEDKSIPPKDVLNELNQLMPIIESKQWHKNMLELMALKIEVLLNLDEFNKADKLINEFLPKAIKANLHSLVIRYQLAELSVADVKGGLKESVRLKEALLAKAEVEKDLLIAASIFLRVGQSEALADNYSLALNYYKKSYELHIANGNNKVETELLNSLANVYLDLSDFDNAKKYYKQTLAIAKVNGDQLHQSITLYNIGKAYFLNEEFQEAKSYFEQSLLLSQLIDDDIGVQWAQFSIAQVLVKDKHWQQALAYYDQTIVAFRKNGDTRLYLDSLIGASKANIGLKNIKKAEELLNTYSAVLSKLNEKIYDAKYLNAYAMLSSAKGDNLTAYKTQKEYSKLKDTIFKAQQKQDLQRYRVQFDSELQENENKILLKQNELNNLKIAQQGQQKKYSYLIIGLASTVILIIILALCKQIQHRNRFKAMALKDHLTNSPNRRAILQYAKERYNEAEHTNMELCIGIIDLDLFKKVNDTFGHDVGDEVLKSFAMACKTVVRKQDRYGRFGGEEWLVVLSDTNKQHIQTIFERLRHELNHSSIPGLPPEKIITFSMGVAQYKQGEDTSLQELINRADTCLYKAKDAGRNQLVMDDDF